MARIRSCLCVLLAGFSISFAGSRLARAEGSAAAGVTLSGRITDAAGQALPEALVSVPEQGRRTASGPDGAYRLGGLSAGRFSVSVSRNGYAPQLKPVTLPRAESLDVSLTATPFEIQPIEVTASRSPGGPSDSPVPTSALGADELRTEHSVSLAHAAEQLPGVRALSSGGEVAKPMIHGLFGARVLVLDNGHRMEDYSWSDEDGPSIDALQADRVEVVRGPASVLYGSEALGGVINAVPADLPDAGDSGSVSHVAAEAYGATNNREFGGGVRLEGAKDAVAWRIFGIGRKSESLHTPDGELGNTGFNAINGEAALGVRGTTGNATLRIARYGGEFQLLEANGGGAGADTAGGPVRKLNDVRGQLDANFLTGSLRLELKGQYQRHGLQEVANEAADPAAGGAPRGVARPLSTAAEDTAGPEFDLQLNTSTVDFLAHHRLGEHVSGTAGVSGMYQTSASTGDIPFIPDGRVSSGAGFALENYTQGQWSFLAGARVDSRHLDFDANPQLALLAQTRTYTQFSGDAGLQYRATPEVTLSANVGRAWRSPTFCELFANGPNIADARFEVGVDSLTAEAGVDVSAGVRVAGPKFRGEIAGYRNQMNRYIYFARTGDTRQVAVGDSLEDFQVYTYGQARAVLTGVDVSAEMEAATALTLRGRFDYVKGDNQDAGEPLPLIPPARAWVEAELHSGTLAWAERAHFGAEVEYSAAKKNLSPYDLQPDPVAGDLNGTDSYVLFNLDAGLEKKLGDRVYTVDIQIRNLADKAYKDFLSRYKEFALNPGRNITLRVSTGI